MNKIFETDTFRKVIQTLNSQEKNWIDKRKKELRIQVTGKILHHQWFLEKRLRNKRLYFLYDNRGKVLFVAFANKKKQQKIINSIINNRDRWLKVLKEL